jgi:hypothetical protein
MIARSACHTLRQANLAGIDVNHLAALELLQEAQDANPPRTLIAAPTLFSADPPRA